MKKLVYLLLLSLSFSCGKEQNELTVKGTVKGLQKGTLYLQKAQDTLFVSVDSVQINGDPSFELHANIESPEVFYLVLDKNDSKEESIPFFANNGVTEINTSLKNFVYDAKIKGSEQQKTWEDYQLMMSKFNNRNLEMLKENLEAQRDGDSSKMINSQKQYDNLLKRKYLYTVNFAVNHKNSEVAPYLALTEVYNANIKLLDTINNVLTPEIKSSKYGKALDSFIAEIKSKEQK
ncbi:DUF4369 domain-containing protein [Mangrovimonas aestuarii]|uniref:DUF4369 domain-containing protein n=1 Tax=Mangrovimonas aestuarii TaxID=3018443 RepID=UPI0023788CFB|nr:DUF4369 domain-containing protein [Mangrovimonas aestuarii]